MSTSDWLGDTRISYDTVAASYAELFREGLAPHPHVRGVLAFFAELLRGTDGPVLDVGCGPGQVTAYLHELGVASSGIDLSPAMVEIARRNHPGLRFDVGSMTDLDVPAGSLGGVLAFFSVIHVPDDQISTVFAHFHRALRPDGVVLLGFHVGDTTVTKTEGYGGHPMKVQVHRRPIHRTSAWLRDAGFTIEGEILLEPDSEIPPGFVLARRPVPTP